jgi:hypothetical protein
MLRHRILGKLFLVLARHPGGDSPSCAPRAPPLAGVWVCPARQ